MMHIKYLSLSLATSSMLVVGCGDEGHHNNEEEVDCTQETRDDAYVAGLEKTGATGLRVVLVESTPAPPAKGDNTWQLRVLGSDGQPFEGAAVEVTPFMPDHNHGTPIVTVVEPQATAGDYEVSPVNLWMPGFWEVTVKVAPAGGEPDEVVFGFCIDG